MIPVDDVAKVLAAQPSDVADLFSFLDVPESSRDLVRICTNSRVFLRSSLTILEVEGESPPDGAALCGVAAICDRIVEQADALATLYPSLRPPERIFRPDMRGLYVSHPMYVSLWWQPVSDAHRHLVGQLPLATWRLRNREDFSNVEYKNAIYEAWKSLRCLVPLTEQDGLRELPVSERPALEYLEALSSIITKRSDHSLFIKRLRKFAVLIEYSLERRDVVRPLTAGGVPVPPWLVRPAALAVADRADPDPDQDPLPVWRLSAMPSLSEAAEREALIQGAAPDELRADTVLAEVDEPGPDPAAGRSTEQALIRSRGLRAAMARENAHVAVRWSALDDGEVAALLGGIDRLAGEADAPLLGLADGLAAAVRVATLLWTGRPVVELLRMEAVALDAPPTTPAMPACASTACATASPP